MRNFIFTLILLLSMPSVLIAQDYRPYNKIAENKVEDVWNDGIYYILISADWCNPCRALKAKLVDYPKTTIYTLDFSETKEVNLIKPADKGIPYFLRVEVVDGKRVVYVYTINSDLKYFIKPVEKREAEKPKDVVSELEADVLEEIKVSEEIELSEEIDFSEIVKKARAVEDTATPPVVDSEKPAEGAFNGLFDKIEAKLKSLEESTNEKIEGLRKERLSIFDMQPLFSRFLEASKERRTILDIVKELKNHLAQVREDNKGLFAELAEFRAERAEFRKDRESLYARMAEAAKERAAAAKERADARKAAVKESLEAARERSKLAKRWADQDRKFTPLLNLTDRFNNWIEALTSSVWKLVGLIVSAIIVIVFVLSLAMGVLSLFKNLVAKLLIKLGLKAVL